MITAAIILSSLLLLAFLRVGIIAEYNDAGLALWLKAGFLKLRLPEITGKKKPHRERFKALTKIKPGSIDEFKDIFKALKKLLRRLRHKLLIKKLIIHYSFAGDDPAAAAILYGASQAFLGFIIPVLERHFRIKQRELRTLADFTASVPSIYVKLNISIAIWEAVYVIAAIAPVFASTGSETKIVSKT